MQIAPASSSLTRKQICKTIFYATPEGQLVAVLGNTHMIVSPEEATACFQRLLDSTTPYRQLLAPERVTGEKEQAISNLAGPSFRAGFMEAELNNFGTVSPMPGSECLKAEEADGTDC